MHLLVVAVLYGGKPDMRGMEHHPTPFLVPPQKHRKRWCHPDGLTDARSLLFPDMLTLSPSRLLVNLRG